MTHLSRRWMFAGLVGWVGLGTACSGVATVSDGNYRSLSSTVSSSGSGHATTGHAAGSTTATVGATGNSTGNGAVSSGSGGHAATTASAAAATGTTTGGACPANLPDIQSGETQSSGACQTNELGSTCANGFTCVSGTCLLNGANGGVQVTLSWDDPEDLDLHVREPQASQPGGYCEIYYGNVGPRPFPDGGLDQSLSQGSCKPVGWLDRDSNPACNLDHVDIENVIYPSSGAPPAGSYSVYADYYQDCANFFTGVAEYPTVNYAIQVRADGQLWKYCASFTPSDADGAGPNGGHQVATFTVP